MITVTPDDWIKIVKYRPIAFGIEAGYNQLQDLHNQWIQSFICSMDDLTYQAHRGSYKTTCVIIALALMLIIYPDETILFMRKTDEDIKEVVRSVKNMLKSNMVQAMAYAFYGKPLALTIDSATNIDTNLKLGPSGTPQLTGIGINGSLTGKHYDIICTDDIVNLKDRVSKAERDRTRLVYQELQNIKNPRGRFVNTGTPWHKNDAFELMGNPQKFDCYSTGMLDEEKIKELRASMSPSLFSANYELKHIADENALFTGANFFEGSQEAIYDGQAHIDAAYGGEDFTAFTIARERDDKIIVYGKLWQKHVDDCLTEILADHENLRAGTIYMERNADKGYLAKELRDKVPVRTYQEKDNKFIKISTWLRKYWSRVYFYPGTDPEYIDQILDYTENAEHDDAPDSLASLIRTRKNRIQVRTFR